MKYTSKLILNGQEYQFAAPEQGWQPGADTILYYDFEHTSGTTETNMAGINNYDGTYQTTPTISTLASGKKILTVNGDNALNTNNTLSTLNYNNATVCVWFNPIYITENFYFGQERRGVQGGTIHCDDYMGSCGACLGVDSNNISFSLNYGSRQNIVITNDGVNSTIYLNGVQVGQTTMTASTGDKYFHVGAVLVYAVPSPATAPSNRLGKASFGSVIIENKVRTAQEIQDYYNQTCEDYGLQPITPWQPGANTIAYYPLDSVNTVNDLSGNGYNLTNSGGVTFGTNAGVDCAYFNYSYLYYSSLSTIPQGNAVRTVSFYVYGQSTDKQIFQRGQSGEDKAFGCFIGGNKHLYITTYGGISLEATVDVTNSWHHVVITHDGSTLKIYVDGQPDNSISGTLGTNGTDFYIGYCTWVSWNFDKYISKFIVEDRVRTAQEIEDYYNQTKSLYGIS